MIRKSNKKKISYNCPSQNAKVLISGLGATDQASSRNTHSNTILEIERLQEEISKLEHEILFYSLSKSWLITRPLRKLGNQISKILHD